MPGTPVVPPVADVAAEGPAPVVRPAPRRRGRGSRGGVRVGRGPVVTAPVPPQSEVIGFVEPAAEPLAGAGAVFTPGPPLTRAEPVAQPQRAVAPEVAAPVAEVGGGVQERQETDGAGTVNEGAPAGGEARPEVNPPGSPGFLRPGMRPGLGRITFTKGVSRQVFRPSGFRPPRAPGMPGLPGSLPGSGPEMPGTPAGELSPPPMPASQQPPAQVSPSQHAMHRGPHPAPQQGGGGGGRGQQGQHGQQRPGQGLPRPNMPGRGRGPQQQQGQRVPPGPMQAPRTPGVAGTLRTHGMEAPGAAPPAHGAPGVSGSGHRGPQVIARAPELPPETIPLAAPPAGTDLSETSALAPLPPADQAQVQPLSPQDAAALAPFSEDIEIEEAPAPAKRREPTGRDMIINVVEGEEIRIAIVRKGQLEELYMERSSTESHVGNIYKGRVTNVEPSIQAAFIDFGIGKNGFLHISDVHPQYFRQNQGRGKGGGGQQPHPRGGPVPRPVGEALPTVDTGAVPTLDTPAAENPLAQSTEPGPEAFTSAYTNGEVESEELLDDYEVEDPGMKPMERVGRKTPRHERPPIQQCLKRGQEVIVQVIKEGIGTKGPTLTSYISCPGRYLVMMPGMSALGVSRKIEDEDQRRELRKILLDLSPPKNLGFIIRTAGTDVSKRELQGDLNYLVRMWKVIANRIRTHRAPVELYQESDLVIRTIRDVFNDEIDRIIIDNEQVASRVRDFLSIVNPRSAGVVELYTGTLPIFQKYNVEREIEKINSRRVEMANGGSLVIDSAEALVAIDVNSGRYREMRDAELTAFNMNKEALKEVCRQLRLRDLGGVVVIDFIDMREDKHKREIERLLKEELKNDRAKTKVLRMSLFCMIEMTRQRVRPSLKRSIYMDCPHCHGSALIKTPESVSLDVMRRLAAATTRAEIVRVELRVYPNVAAFVLNRKRKQLVELEERTGKRINITADPNIAGDAIVIEGYDARSSMLNVVL